MSGSLDRSYAYCRAVVRRSSSNLAWCFWLLPKDQRRAMDALYAFARQADDLVDRDLPVEERRAAFAGFRRDLDSALDGDAKPPLFPAIADTLQRFSIRPQLLETLLDGVALDLMPQTPANFAELHAYCYRVASVVGLACLPIWGCTDERATQPAIDCGIAFQLTNILRDLKEDAERGRCYLPRDELERFGVCAGWDRLRSPTQSVGRRAPAHPECCIDPGGPAPATGGLVPPYQWSEPLAELCDFQIARARTYYESAEETARYLPPPGRRVFALMTARYRSILAAIERDPAQILCGRVSLSWPRKVVVAAGALLSSPKSKVQSPKSTTKPTLDFGPWTFDLPKVAVVGGGLAGLAAAVALCQRGVRVELFEARHKLGGRAGSYADKESGELVDHCQHVAMGCCTNFLDFCRQTNIAEQFTRHRTLHFFGPDGKRCDFRASALLPAPLHLAPALREQTYLSAADRRAIASAMLRLARLRTTDDAQDPTIGHWLRERKQSLAAIEHFWKVVLVSALGESLDRASLTAARKVFVDGFMAASSAYEVLTPNAPLGELYDERVAGWLRKRGVTIHLGCSVEQIAGTGHNVTHVLCKDGRELPFDFVVAALPWRRLPDVLAPELAAAIPEAVRAANEMQSSPIAGIHLWFDRPFTDLPHAVIVGRLSQWVFSKCRMQSAECSAPDHETTLHSALGTLHYYQVVISASRVLAGRERNDVLTEVLGDLHAVFPQSRTANLLRWQMITDQDAVFSVLPGLSQIRPPQRTAVPNLFLAGDWTATGWPATMEGAVRSGYLAAEALLESFGRRQSIVAPDLPRSWLARWLIRNGAS